jgi:hypothetical protein
MDACSKVLPIGHFEAFDVTRDVWNLLKGSRICTSECLAKSATLHTASAINSPLLIHRIIQLSMLFEQCNGDGERWDATPPPCIGASPHTDLDIR